MAYLDDTTRDFVHWSRYKSVMLSELEEAKHENCPDKAYKLFDSIRSTLSSNVLKMLRLGVGAALPKGSTLKSKPFVDIGIDETVDEWLQEISTDIINLRGISSSQIVEEIELCIQGFYEQEEKS